MGTAHESGNLLAIHRSRRIHDQEFALAWNSQGLLPGGNATNWLQFFRAGSQPLHAGALGIEIRQHHIMAAPRIKTGDIGGQRRLATATFGVQEQNRAHESNLFIVVLAVPDYHTG